jgi:hypothetical protein
MRQGTAINVHVFWRPVFPFSFRAEASSRGDRVKNDVPIRLSVKSQNPGGTAILAVGSAGILPADKLPAGGRRRDETLWASWATKLRQPHEGIYYADKRTLLPLTEDNVTHRLSFGVPFQKVSRIRLPSPQPLRSLSTRHAEDLSLAHGVEIRRNAAVPYRHNAARRLTEH